MQRSLMGGGFHRERGPNHWQDSWDPHLIQPQLCPTNGVHLNHLNKPEVLTFPVCQDKRLESLAKELEKDMQAKSKRRVYHYKTTGRVQYDEFYIKLSKPIIDKIDRVLAKHYGFTDEELDFIINYDIKYRMGREYSND